MKDQPLNPLAHANQNEPVPASQPMSPCGQIVWDMLVGMQKIQMESLHDPLGTIELDRKTADLRDILVTSGRMDL